MIEIGSSKSNGRLNSGKHFGIVKSPKLLLSLTALSGFMLLGILLPYQSADAASKDWDSGGDGSSYSDPLNWNPDGVPASTDSKTIGSGFTVHIDTDVTVEQDGFFWISEGSQLVIDTGNTLTIANSINESTGVNNFGTITNHGTLVVENTQTLQTFGTYGIGNFGTINNDASMVIQNSGPSYGIINFALISNSGTLTVSNSRGQGIDNENGTMTNSGTLTVSNSAGAGIRVLDVDSHFSNLAAGNVIVSNSGGTGFHIFNGNPIDNYGTITISNSGGTGMDTGGDIANFNSGTITVSNSAGLGIRNNGPIRNYGAFEVNGGSVNLLTSTFYVNEDSTMNINEGGIVNVTFFSHFRLDDGTLNINSGGTFNINSGGSVFAMDISTINVNSGGVVSINPEGTLEIWSLGTLNVNSGGVVNLSCEGTLYVTGTVNGPITVEPGCDTTAPVITILGANPATVLVGLTYTDAGATVTDDFDPSLTLNTVSTVNTAVAGTYTVTYSVEDDSGNDSTATRTVIVITPSAATQNLIDSVNSQVTDKNTKSALLSTLKEIQKILNDGNPTNDKSACSKLSSFIVTVDSKEASGKLSSTLAQQFRDLANAMRNSLGC